tara:strand:+ start:895 stop:1926 length:1032 start_codon:yes stop_codon:yes gene_type:complete
MTSVVSTAKGTTLARSLDSGNALLNSEFDRDNYPVWTSWNGLKYSSTYFRNIGVFKGLANWVHYSPLFNQGYSTYVGNQFLFLDRRRSPNDLAPYLAGYQPRIIKLYGAENLWKLGAGGPVGAINNDNADRGESQVGVFTNAGNSRIVSNTTLSSINSGTSMTSTSCWSRVTEWQQHLNIPDNCTSIKFGAQIRVQSTDKLRPLNFAGIYCAEDVEAFGYHNRYVNYFGIRHTDATFTLPTGSLTTGDRSRYNWNGLAVGDTHAYYRFYTPSKTAATEHAMLDQDDYEDFKKVEYTFTPQSGTNRKMSLNLFFAENTSYLKAAAGNLSGGFQVYDPFVEFLTS